MGKAKMARPPMTAKNSSTWLAINSGGFSWFQGA